LIPVKSVIHFAVCKICQRFNTAFFFQSRTSNPATLEVFKVTSISNVIQFERRVTTHNELEIGKAVDTCTHRKRQKEYMIECKRECDCLTFINNVCEEKY